MAFGYHQLASSFGVISVSSRSRLFQVCTGLNLEDLITTLELSPVENRRLKCTLMMMANLVYSEWISVNCNRLILKHTVCYSDLNKTALPKKEKVLNNETCIRDSFLKAHVCYRILWLPGNYLNTGPNNMCGIQKMKHHSVNKIELFDFLLHATSQKTFQLFSEHPATMKQTSYHYERLFLTHYRRKHSAIADKSAGFFVCEGKPSQNAHCHNIFYCANGRFISKSFLCDGANDCDDSNGTDEQHCTCDPSLFYVSVSGKCLSFTKRQQMQQTKEEMFMCSDNSSISASLVNDLVSDCGKSADDEKDLINLLIQDTYLPCSIPDQIPCRNGHMQCYNFSEICSYKLNTFNKLVPCRTGEHLEDCTQFECNMELKCPDFYCIPYSHLCDGKWDCPHGEDELTHFKCGEARICTEMFKCKNSAVCLHIGYICDGFIDCHLKDDEQMCDLQQACLSYCQCFHYAMKCESKNISTKKFFDAPYISLTLRYTSITEESFLVHFTFLAHLSLNFNDLEFVCLTNLSPKIKVFDAALNGIVEVSSGCFKHLDNLLHINLSCNKIHSIASNAFVSLPKLHHVDISRNFLSEIPPNAFNLSCLKTLWMSNNPLNKITSQMFGSLEVNKLLTDDFRVCCVAASALICPSEPPWHLSCGSMLPNTGMKISVCVVSFLILVPNILCITLAGKHITSQKTGLIFTMIVFFIHIGDTLCGFHLIILWIVDLFYGVSFIVNDMKWKRSTFCILAFFFSLSFSIIVPCYLTILTIARFSVIINPFKSKFTKKSFILKVLLCTFCVIVTSSAALTVQIGSKDALPSNLCSPFVDPTDSILEIKIQTLVITLSQFCALMCIVVLYIWIFNILVFHHGAGNQLTTRTHLKVRNILQVVVATTTNILSWLPSGVIFVSSIMLSFHSVDLVIWTTIALVPINSILNPIIFSFSFKPKVRKRKSSSGNFTEASVNL